MTAEDLLKALNGLRMAVDNELPGEARDGALQDIKGLFQLAGFDGEDAGECGGDEVVPFAQAIAAVRFQAEGELFGSALDRAGKILDGLASLSSHVTPSEPEPPLAHASEPQTSAHAEPSPAAAAGAPMGASFDDVAAASKARVEAMAASLGMAVVQHYEPPPQEEQPSAEELEDFMAGMEFEKRSSEPCCMPEIVPLAEELAAQPGAVPEAAATEVVQAASAREVAEATHDFGMPAAEAGHVPEYAASHEKPAALPETAPSAPPREVVAETPPVIVTRTEPRPSSPASAAPSVASRKVEAAATPHEKVPEKTFFGLWLDMIFGRKK